MTYEDPLLPPTIKPHLYARDEYQTSDLIVLSTPVYASDNCICCLWNGYTYDTKQFTVTNPNSEDPPFIQIDAYRNYRGYYKIAQVIPGPWQLYNSPSGGQAAIPGTATFVEGEGDNALILDWDNPILGISKKPHYWKRSPFPDPGTYNDPHLPSGDIRQLGLLYVDGTGQSTSYLVQRYSTWDHPWCNAWVQKVFNFFSQNELCAVWRKSFTAKVQTYDQDYEWVAKLKSYARSTSGISVGWVLFKWRKSYYDFSRNAVRFNQIKLSLNSPQGERVIITYLAVEGDWFSKQYVSLDLIGGTNDVLLNLDNLDIVLGSIVVSSSNGSTGAVAELMAYFANKNKFLLYEHFDDFLQKLDEGIVFDVQEMTKNYQGDVFTIINKNVDTSAYGSLYFANNNPWTDEPIFADINPLPGIKPYCSYPDSYGDLVSYMKSIYYDEGKYSVPDSIRLQEIHASLNATKFGKNETKANLGFYIEFISQILGGSFNPNGTTRSIRQMRRIPDGSNVPAGWDRAQFSVNERGKDAGQKGGNSGEFAPGIVYQQRTNKLTPNQFNPEASEITGGDLILCENLPQLLEAFWDDLSKGLDLQNAGAGAIPNADGNGGMITYEGIHQLLVEIAFAISRISAHTSEGLISSMVTQATAKECLAGLGLPLETGAIGVETSEGKGFIPYPSLAGDGPTITSQLGWILQNVGRLNLANLTPKPSDN